MEGITLTLLKLVVKSGKTSLQSLLLLLARRHLRLPSGNLSGLILNAKIGSVHAASLLDTRKVCCIAIGVLTNPSRRLCARKTLRKLLLTKSANSLTLTNVLTKELLADISKICASGLASLKSLLTDI